jgi:hypothetical protein
MVAWIRFPQDQLLTFLRYQELLLLLDNYEQLLPNVTFLTQLLRSVPGLTILVTSRERLAMQAEYLFEITGLAYPLSASAKRCLEGAPCARCTRFDCIKGDNPHHCENGEDCRCPAR